MIWIAAQLNSAESRSVLFRVITTAAMKLLTHNMLACHIKGVRNNYPFLIEAVKVESRAADYDPGVGRAGASMEMNTPGVLINSCIGSSQIFYGTSILESNGQLSCKEHRV
jgi:hypothetical protein